LILDLNVALHSELGLDLIPNLFLDLEPGPNLYPIAGLVLNLAPDLMPYLALYPMGYHICSLVLINTTIIHMVLPNVNLSPDLIQDPVPELPNTALDLVVNLTVDPTVDTRINN
jgi:hypothetical protein